MVDQTRTFKFGMTCPSDFKDTPGEEFKAEWTVLDYNPDYEYELDYLLTQFKNFLKMCGYSDLTVSRLQYLEDKEFEYVLKAYGEWTSEHEKYWGNKSE